MSHFARERIIEIKRAAAQPKRQSEHSNANLGSAMIEQLQLTSVSALVRSLPVAAPVRARRPAIERADEVVERSRQVQRGSR